MYGNIYVAIFGRLKYIKQQFVAMILSDNNVGHSSKQLQLNIILAY